MHKHFFFRFLQPISCFGLYLRNENQPSWTFQLGMSHMKNIQNLISYKKFIAIHPLPLKMVLSHKWFFTIVSILIEEHPRGFPAWRYTRSNENFMENKLYSCKISPEKLQNECKNPSFLHKVICIRLDRAGTVAKFHIYSFIL